MDKIYTISYTNCADIIKALYFRNNLSILEISKITGSSVPTTTKNVYELIRTNYITEMGSGISNGGRKPALYTLVKERAYIVAVAMDQFDTKIALTNLHGQFINEITEIALDLKNDVAALEVITAQINAVIKLSGIKEAFICGIGISMPGFIDVEKGINHSFLKPPHSSLQQYISAHTGLPVFLDNDSSTIALAELRFGENLSVKEAMVINIGWGIGLGMIVKGQLFRGFSGFAGEFSHIPLFNNNKLCSCGKRGCLETEASLITLEDNALDAISKGQITSIIPCNDRVTIASIIKEALKGDTYAIKLISESAYHIGRAVAILIHILNPQTIVLSGKGIKAGKLWLAPVQQALNEFCIPTLISNTNVVLSQLGTDAQLIGSAALVIENLDRSFFKVDQQLSTFKKETSN